MRVYARVYVCVGVLPKSRNGQPHSSESLTRWHRDQRSGSVQTSYWLVTAWTRRLHFPACCWSRWTPRCGLGQQKWVTFEKRHTKKNPELIIPTQEPGRFLPTESCALVVHSLQASVCTVEHHGPLGFPGWTRYIPEIFLSTLTISCRHDQWSFPHQGHLPGSLADFSFHLVELQT